VIEQFCHSRGHQQAQPAVEPKTMLYLAQSIEDISMMEDHLGVVDMAELPLDCVRVQESLCRMLSRAVTGIDQRDGERIRRTLRRT